MLDWQWKHYDELTANELYAILKARQEVFVVEQDCAYLDVDDLDQDSWHLMGWSVSESGTRTLSAYLRLVGPDNRYAEPSIGRVLTSADARQSGLGRESLRLAIEHAGKTYPTQAIRISAQQHLAPLYTEFGFTTVSEPYDEDGIPHVEMLRSQCAA